jgi:hypothetical protein
MAQLDLSAIEVERELSACKEGQIPIQSTFDSDVGAHDYLPYAVASSEVYGPDGRIDASEFTLDRYGDGWTGTKTSQPLLFNKGFLPTNLTFEYYIQDKGDKLLVIVAFRGTTLLRDWLSNASWFLRWLPISDHYDDARTAFRKIRAEVMSMAHGRSVNYVVTGHSLGGGLAIHIAYGFPCVSAVVFNASPVINHHIYQRPFDDAKIVNIVQNCEALGVARALTGGDKPFPYLAWLQNMFGGKYFSRNYHFYNYDAQINAGDKDKGCIERTFLGPNPSNNKIKRFHNMDNYLQGLARWAIECELGASRPCPFHHFDAARRVYCIPRKASEKDAPCACNNWPADRRASNLCFM